MKIWNGQVGIKHFVYFGLEEYGANYFFSKGKRHPFQGEYKVGYTADGKIQAVDVQLYSNGGCTHDLSWPVMERAMFHSDNFYNVPHMDIKGNIGHYVIDSVTFLNWAMPYIAQLGRVCKTNLPSNTAFRGFGGPQGMVVVESWIEHVAHALGKKWHPMTVSLHYLSVFIVLRCWTWEDKREEHVLVWREDSLWSAFLCEVSRSLESMQRII